MSKALALFQSVHQVMKVERACLAEELRFQIVAVPKDVSSECGMAMEIDTANQTTLENICSDLEVNVTVIRR